MVGLKELSKEYSEKSILYLLENFKNTKDSDIQEFLNVKAVDFERRKVCSSYLLIDADSVRVEGYFSLAFMVYEFEEISNRMKKRLCNGYSDKTAIPVILIGQLGKYIDEETGDYGNTSAEELLGMAFDIIKSVTEKIPCSCVLLECKDDNRDKLQQLYENYGFVEACRRNGYIEYVYRM